MTNWKINVNVHRWKQNQIISELELKAEGVNIAQWEKDMLILPIGVKEPEKVISNLDLNGDGKVDKEDASIAGKVMNKFKSKKGRR